jgi:hypothetical protein
MMMNSNIRILIFEGIFRNADEISWTEIAQNFGSSTRRIKGSIACLLGL